MLNFTREQGNANTVMRYYSATTKKSKLWFFLQSYTDVRAGQYKKAEC